MMRCSGVGFVGNALMLPRPERGVVQAPFRAPLKPFLTARHRTLAPVSRAFIDWIASGDDPRRLPTIALPALFA